MTAQTAPTRIARPVEQDEQQAVFFHLNVRIWLPSANDGKLGTYVRHGFTQKGTPRISFPAAPSGYNDRAINSKTNEKGCYLSGDLFNFEATDNGYGNLASDIGERIESGNGRLVDVKAQFKPYQYTDKTGQLRTGSSWFIVELVEVPRASSSDDSDPQIDEEFDKIVGSAES
jgi:hypothetical protein